MIIYHDVKQGTEEWKDKRRGLWTGSTAIRLLHGKPLPPESDWDGFKDAALRGHALEVAAMREYERKYQRKVDHPGFVTNTAYTNAGFSPDGIDGGWLLESKSLLGIRHDKLVQSGFSARELELIIASKIPLEIKAQIFFGMIITGRRKARLLAFNPDIVDREQLTIIEIGYDKLIGKNIRDKLRQDMKRRRAIADA